MKFWQLYRVAAKRKWMIVGLVLVTIVAIYASTADDKPYYRATVRIMPSDAALRHPILPSSGVNVAGGVGERVTDSQLPNLMSLIKSKRVAERTVQLAGLKISPDELLGRVDVGTAENPGAQSRDDLGTDLIQIRVSDLKPEMAVSTVNALAHVFSSFYQELSHQEATDNRRFLESELRRAEEDLNTASQSLKQFKTENDLSATVNSSEAAVTAFRSARAERDAAQAALAETQAKLSDVNGQLARIGQTRTVVEGTSNTPMLSQLESQLADLTRQLNDARSKYEDTHPKVVTLKESIDETSRKLKAEQGNLRKSVSVVQNPLYDSLVAERSKLTAERDGLAARVSQLSAVLSRASSEVDPAVGVNLTRLESDFTEAQTTYSNIKSQLMQARVSEKETTQTGAIRVIDEASAAEGPIGTNKKLYVILGSLLSLMFGVGLAITLDSIDNRIKTNVDLEHLLGLPVTALIPTAIGSGSSSLARVTYTEPLSPVAEAFRFLRTDLLLSTQISGERTIMVATAKPGQGGTSTVANLGISLAQDGKRVVLVDADMRRPSLHRIFKSENEIGLSNALSNECDFEEALVSTEVDNLLLIPGGPTPSNPSELLGSGRMRAMVQWLAENADYVLFDTPSAVAFTDAVVLSQVVDGVVLVVRAQQVPRGAELQVRNLLNKAGARILGVVLNDVQPETVDSCYYHSHYYPDVGIAKQKLLRSGSSPRLLPPTEEQG